MQFAVPQFTDVEDKLIGPLTLKQFLVLLATGGIIMFFYSILNLSIFFFLFAIPFGLLGLAVAFGKFNGRPAMEYAGVFINYLSRPQVRVFKREEPTVFVQTKTEIPNDKLQITNKLSTEETESRLKKLAYLLDQKTAEEKKLIEKN
jgi:hypothetical protein